MFTDSIYGSSSSKITYNQQWMSSIVIIPLVKKGPQPDIIRHTKVESEGRLPYVIQISYLQCVLTKQ